MNVIYIKQIYILIFLVFIGFNLNAQWEQVGNTILGEAAGDKSGRVSMSSDGLIIAIGALENDGNGSNSGHVRVFQNIAGNWQQLGNDIDGETAGDRFGSSVCLSSDGTILAAGSQTNSENGTWAGHVRIFQYNSGVWEQLGNDIDGEAPVDLSGTSVSLSSDGLIVAIGAIENDGNGSNSGHVRVFNFTSNTWQQMGADIDGEAVEDHSGCSVSLSADGSVVAIGAFGNSANGYESGHVRVYKYNSGVWNKIGNDIDGEAAGDWFGKSVRISSDGSIVAAGAQYNDDNGVNSGHVRLFQNNSGTWIQIGNDIDGESEGDYSGSSFDINTDASIIAIGAPSNDGNGTDSGNVRFFKNNSGTWEQIGDNIEGEMEGDRASTVCISENALIVAVGASRNDTNGIDSGHVRVFHHSTANVLENMDNLYLYPNPATLKVLFSKELPNTYYKIISSTGLVCKKGKIKNQIIDIKELPASIYFIEVLEKKTFNTKVIKMIKK